MDNQKTLNHRVEYKEPQAAILLNLSGKIEGTEKYILTYNFSDINKLGDVLIPDDVINNATEKNDVISIDF